uniref:Uncharacterized protein n=1 Tax=Mimivirus LCMiAC01 TaxID=2506608 RepID=A0A481YZK2_9VIRU|nr:MAG: hypothetical protein LCMiAC01_00050 [Mimivirus LCMiAC01]
MNFINKIRGNQDCYEYNIKWWHFFVPSIDEINPLCESHDKTYMFIVAVLRTLLYYFIFTYLKNRNYINIIYTDTYKFLGYLIFIIIIGINILLLVNIFYKKQYIEKLEKSTKPTKYEDELFHYPVKARIPLPKTPAEIELNRVLRSETHAKAELLSEMIHSNKINVNNLTSEEKERHLQVHDWPEVDFDGGVHRILFSHMR